ncbi:hypothetical protein C8R44DRAFT_761718 [Mycena epipterygia]|nr:hypothetical protein C8R44DRAFT_761718 [Mycena epipterygia]
MAAARLQTFDASSHVRLGPHNRGQHHRIILGLPCCPHRRALDARGDPQAGPHFPSPVKSPETLLRALPQRPVVPHPACARAPRFDALEPYHPRPHGAPRAKRAPTRTAAPHH